MSSKLVRGLSLMDAIALVVGTIIGTGVFLKSATMADQVGSPAMVLLVWVIAGLLSLAGALTFAELGALFPRAGGEYVYLREAYGDMPAFLYGWMRFWIASPGTIAAYAVGAATFLEGAVPIDAFGGKAGVAFLFITFFTFLNCFQVAVGGRLNSFITLLKVMMMVGLLIGVLFFSETSTFLNLNAPMDAKAFTISGFGLAMLSALWAYDGWNNLSMVAGEIKNPEKNVPMSLSVGVLIVLGIYLLVNLGYFLALPFSEVLTANSDLHQNALPIATKAVQTFLGVAGVTAVSYIFVVSALGAMNGSILSNARVPYAMANDGLFFRQLAFLHKTSHVPVFAVIVQGVMSVALAFMGTFNELTDYVIFASWLFYGLVAASVFVFRKKHKDVKRHYKVWGYPLVPLVFVAVSIFLVINTIVEMPKQTGIGIVLILIGVPVYLLVGKYWKKEMR